MSGQAWFALILFLAVLITLSVPLGSYLARIAHAAPIGGILGRLERALYRAAGVDAEQDMPWTRYAVAVVLFNVVGVAVVYLTQRLQLWLPLNPQQLANVRRKTGITDSVLRFASHEGEREYAKAA